MIESLQHGTYEEKVMSTFTKKNPTTRIWGQLRSQKLGPGFQSPEIHHLTVGVQSSELQCAWYTQDSWEIITLVRGGEESGLPSFCCTEHLSAHYELQCVPEGAVWSN